MAFDVGAVNQVTITGKDESGPAFDSAKASLASLGAAATDTGRYVQAAFGVLGAAAFAGAITGAIEMEAELSRLAERTGVGVEALSAMRLAAKNAGVDMEQVAQGLQRFAKNIDTAGTGTGVVADALRRLGFDARTFASSFGSTDAALLAVAQRLNQYQDGLGKTAAAQELLGRAGANLLPFLKELAEKGLAGVTVTAEQAKAARELEDAWNKLKATGQALIVSIANALIPVLQAVVDGFSTFKTIALEALAALVLWPAVVNASAAALVTYREAALAAALANEVLGASTSTMGVLFGNFFGSFGKLFGTIPALLKSLGGVIFAAIAGWQIGTWLSEQFVEVRVAAYSLVGWLLEAWENIKYGAQVALETLKLGFVGTFNQIGTIIGGFIEKLGVGLGYIPGLSDISVSVENFGKAMQSVSSGALTQYDAKIGELKKQNDAAKASIHDMTVDFIGLELAARKVSGVPEVKPILPAGGQKAIVDYTTAIDNYQKQLAALAKAYTDAQAKIGQQAITNALADLDRSYQQGLTAFKAYYDQRLSLQRSAQSLEESTLQADIDIQAQLVAGLQAQINAINPANFKTTEEYIKAVYKASGDLLTAYTALTKAQGALGAAQEKGNQIGKDAYDLLVKANPIVLQNALAVQQQAAAQQIVNEQLGMSASAIQLDLVARAQDMIARRDELGLTDDEVKAIQALIAARQKLAGVLQTGEDLKQQLDLIKSTTDALATGLVDVVQHGMSGFRDMWERFKQWGLEALAKIAAQKIVVSIVGLISPSLANAAGASFGAAGNPLSSLFDLLGLGGIGSSLTGGGFGQNDRGTGTSALGGLTGLLPGLNSIASFLPLLGFAIPLLGSLFSKTPSQVEGTFGFRGPGEPSSTFEDSASTSSKIGGGLQFGFLDQGTQQFSGEAAQVFNKIVGGAIDAFSTRFSPAQSEAFATTLKNMTFQAFSGTFTTEDFLQKYGGQILQQVVTAAFNVLDPALGSVIANFHGTADEVSKFANTLLSLYDATKSLPDAVRANIDAALDGTQATADKVLAFAQVLGTLQGPLSGLHDSFLKLSGTDIPALVNALGGADAFMKAQAFLFENFTTGADKMALAIKQLDDGFTALGVTTLPQTHQQFLDLLNSLDLTTDAGRQMYAGLLNLEQLFVTVHGTADQAADALNGVSTSLQAIADAQKFFDANFYTQAEQSAAKLAQEQKLVSDAQEKLGLTIPTTVDGFRQLVEQVRATQGADSDLYKALIVLAPAIYDIGKAAGTAANQISAAAATIANIGVDSGAISNAAQKFVNKFTAGIDAILQNSTGDYGDKAGIKSNLISQEIASLQSQYQNYITNVSGGFIDATAQQLQTEIDILTRTNQGIAQDLAQFTVLKAQYGAGIAEQLVQLEDWYAQQQRALGRSALPDELAALKTIFDDKWKAIIAGTASGVDGALSQLDKLRQGIAQYLQGLQVGNLSPLSPQQQLASAKQAYELELTKALGGDQSALGDITKYADTFLQQARSFYASSQAYTDIFNQVTGQLGGIAGTTPTGTGALDPATRGILAALPTNAKIVSSDDLSTQVTKLIAAIEASIAALANANTADSETATEELTTELAGLQDELATIVKGR